MTKEYQDEAGSKVRESVVEWISQPDKPKAPLLAILERLGIKLGGR